jgi:hypothetical protein
MGLLGPGADSCGFQTAIAADTVYGQGDTQTRLASDTADNLDWDRYTIQSKTHGASLASSLSRIKFSKETSAKPLHKMLELVSAEVTARASSGRTVVAVVGRSRRLAIESHKVELRELNSKRGSPVGLEVSKTLGDVGAALIVEEMNTSLLVLQHK